MKTLIAEDIRSQQEHVAHLLQERVPEAMPLHVVGDGAEAVRVAEAEQPVLMVLDIQLPGLNGIEVARRVWHTQPQARILFWSQFKDEIYVRRLAQIVPAETVYGYVLKTSSEEKLVSAVRALLLEEQCWIDREVRGVQARATAGPTALTDSEYEALIDVALGLTDRGVATRRYLSRRGAQTRIHALYVKLGVDRAEDETGGLFSPRACAVFEGLRRGLLNADVLREENESLVRWLEENPDVPAEVASRRSAG